MPKSDVPDCLRDHKGLIAWTSVVKLYFLVLPNLSF